MKHTYFIDLHPTDMEGECANHHLLKVELSPDAKKGAFPNHNKTHCGRYYMDKNADISWGTQLIVPDSFRNRKGLPDPDPDQYDEHEYMDYVRLYLAEQQSAGTDYCAHCVAKFYKFEKGDE